MKLAGKTALVTGASRGIGRAIAESFAEAGIHVYGTSRDPDAVDWPSGISPMRMDISSPETVQQGWDVAQLRESRFDIVVNNAGAGAFGSFADFDFDQWEEQVATLLLGSMKVAHLALQQWTPDCPGTLVNVSSLAVEYPIPYMSGYNVAKAGLAAFCESLRLECDSSAVRILELRLGDVNTSFNERMQGKAKGGRQERVWAAMCRHVANGPSSDHVAEQLVKYLRNDRSGVVRVGSFFQAFLSSVFGKFVSQGIKRAANLSYYSLGNDR
ncbi:SDR family NAD(P)-dependent oxidoreductase [Pelagicoccus sp. SDUM812002]|uniref:SDR family NAD(P)-dependent oxidoreductase n=1 Tax=Pelagicoccus sp. SDUM812002 TaxID=3041266 RepID=UPI00280D1277|nr:SDR family NAD(P)-dependent oxidoreductase [Pelagicoccus sp. SDUM812002]MDQ8184564.1 SDR family NAD(P)-dependent oxidoreductase [Pelagicoccus sp. SDUM812002]